MKFAASFALLLTSLTAALAQNASGDALVQALRMNNLNSLANVVGNNSAAVLPLLMGGNKTVFAPSDQAFSQANIDMQDTQRLLAVLQYHIVNSTLTGDAVPDDDNEHAIVLSSLRGEPYVQLPNNRSQALVIAQGQDNNNDNDNNDDNDSDNMGRIIQPSQNVSFNLGSAVSYQNVRLVPINNVLSVPGALPSTLQTLNLTMLSTLAQQNQLVQPLNTTDALTVFAPTNAAIQSVMDQYNMANDDQKRAVVANHVINGTVVYSTQLSGDDGVENATSASGQQLTFEEDDDALYVRSGDVRARIVRSDNLASNGVVHIIDTVLLNTMSNPAAASSAASSAAAAPANTGGVSGGTNGDDNDNDNNDNDMNGAMGVAAGIATVGLVALSSGMLLLA